MKKYTLEDIEKFDVIDGVKIFPTGDYRGLYGYSFGEECRFGEWCRFGRGCRIGRGCIFGEECSFGRGCSFGEECSFGEGCNAVSPFWGFIYLPPFKIKGHIYPPESCRKHYMDRLISFGIIDEPIDGCYSTIAEELLPKLDAILEQPLIPVERMIFESWRKYDE